MGTTKKWKNDSNISQSIIKGAILLIDSQKIVVSGIIICLTGERLFFFLHLVIIPKNMSTQT